MNQGSCFVRHLCVVMFVYGVCGVGAIGGDESDQQKCEVRRYVTKKLIVHTDQSPQAASQLIRRLEKTLLTLTTCWGRPLRSRIECFIIDDFDSWKDVKLPNEDAMAVVRNLGGVTETIAGFRSRRGKRQRAKAIVYACDRSGIPEHELAHAYLYETYGANGPDWFNEGVAQMAAADSSSTGPVNCCSDAEMQYLRNHQSIALCDVTSNKPFTTAISNSVVRDASSRRSDPRPTDSNRKSEAWGPKDDAIVAEARKSYLLSWAVCHLLHHNDNYRDRFRLLGRAYMMNDKVVFGDVFGSKSEEIGFELQQFLTNIEPGYRVDLCRWDWNGKSQQLARGESISCRVRAARGYQRTEVELKAGQTYEISASGKWSIGTEKSVGANGCEDGNGRLVAAVFREFKLSDPIDVGESTIFLAQEDGLLVLRCKTEWGAIAGNDGALTVTVKRTDGQRR